MWSMKWSAPNFLTYSCVSAREAEAITLSPATFLAIYIAIEPTPPAPPTINIDFPLLSEGFRESWRCSKNASHIVTATRGKEAAISQSTDFGLWATILSSTN